MFSSLRLLLSACAVLTLAAPAFGQTKNVEVLRVGTSGTLTGKAGKEPAALATLQSFIKEETGLNNDIIRQKDWQELAEKMLKGTLQIGVFQGFEFVWAKEKYPKLKPLALCVNVYRYPVVYVIVKRDSQLKSFGALRGKTLALPATGQGYSRLVLERHSEAQGKPPAEFFSKITHPETAEDALDDVVDGVAQATVVDRATLEAYQRRKPARFKQLTEVVHSPPLLPTIIADYDAVLDEATLQQFRQGLLTAANKERGKVVLTMFRLTGFDAVPADFGQVAAEMRKNFPPPSQAAK